MPTGRVLLRSNPNLGFICIILHFYDNLFIFRINPFLHCIFDIFYPRMNKPNILTTIIAIFSFRNGLNHPFSSTSFYFSSKIVEGNHEM